MPTLGVYNYVDVPAPDVARGGILRTARVVDVTDPHDLLGAQYLTDACAGGQVWEEFCTMNPTAAKVFDEGPDVVQGEPFVVYAGVQCTLQDLDEAKTRARRRLDYSERHQIDLLVQAWLDGEAIDLGAGPYPVHQGVGMLEGYAAALYGGVPTLVLSTGAVACMCGAGCSVITDLTGRLTTCQGTPIANVSLDPNDVGATSTAYVTGQITLLRGPVESISVPQQPKGDGTYEPPRALAERIYVPLIECLAAKVEVTCE